MSGTFRPFERIFSEVFRFNPPPPHHPVLTVDTCICASRPRQTKKTNVGGTTRLKSISSDVLHVLRARWRRLSRARCRWFFRSRHVLSRGTPTDRSDGGRSVPRRIRMSDTTRTRGRAHTPATFWRAGKRERDGLRRDGSRGTVPRRPDPTSEYRERVPPSRHAGHVFTKRPTAENLAVSPHLRRMRARPNP